MRATLLPFLLVLALALLATGCGDSDSGSEDTGNGDSAGETTGDEPAAITEHVDGTAKVEGKQLVLTPKGRAPITFDLGEDVALASVRALEVAGEPVRVSYEPARGDANAVAISVQPVQAHDGQQSYTGTIVKVDADSITITGDDGEKTYAMGIADAHEVDHLGEHMDERSPVTVFLASDAAEPTVVAYEDA